MKYPEERVIYYTGFWQMFKYAIVQYIAILVIFAFLCERLKLFVFSHQLVNTVAIKPYKNSWETDRCLQVWVFVYKTWL